MAETVKLAATASAGNSGDISVAAGESVSVYIYGSAGSITEDVQVKVLRKIGATGNYQPCPGNMRVPEFLTREMVEVVLSAPGVYRFDKPATTQLIGIAEFR